MLYYVPQLIWEYNLNKVQGFEYFTNQYLAAKIRAYSFLEHGEGAILKGVTNAINVCLDAMNSFGFGKFEARKINEKEKFLNIIVESTLGRNIKFNFGHQPQPVDFMYAGLFAGALEFYAKDRIYGVEINCIAEKETPSCEFIAGSKEKVFRYVNEFAPEKKEWVNKVVSETEKKENKLLPSGIKDYARHIIK